ncbi:MAG: M1 family aminopeptidase [Bacteroidota bacterium]|nr:M1 family aminopeptidase [Bacteroidota bacterium]
MHKRPLLIVVMFLAPFLTTVSSGQIIFEKPLSQRIANYTINATLHPETKTIEANMILEWKNTSPDTIRELQFHMYMNAFSNSESTFMKESGGQHRGFSLEKSNAEDWGYIKLNALKAGKENLIQQYQYISPDDGNTEDQTVFSVKLSEPVYPGKQVIIKSNFTVKLPRIFARTGYSDNYFMVGQWFPKIGVYQNGDWNCHQFHSNSEFFADYGSYEVNISLPEEYIVGSTGVLVNEKKTGKGKKTLFYRAEDVIDFAWTASKDYQVVETNWNDVNIRLMIQPEHLKIAGRYLSSVKAALQYFEEKLGKYPYPNLTIVDPPLHAGGAGGMEYPCLITGISVKYLPKSVRITEMVTIHEFGHQYFMGLLATDEFEEAWLDEGMNTYFETKIMDKTYGEGQSMVNYFGIKIGDTEMQRSGYLNSKSSEFAIVNTKSWDYEYGGYAVMNYNKPATFLVSLERMIGSELMDEIFKSYYDRYKFKHPTTEDFVNLVSEKVSKTSGIYKNYIRSFFNQFLNSSNICDYKVKRIKERKAHSKSGLFGKKHKFKTSEATGEIITEVILERKGNFIIPVEVEIIFDNGDKIRKLWNGESQFKTFSFAGTAKIVSAEIDPDKKIYFDANLNNNSISRETGKAGIRKYILKVLFWLQNVMQSVTFFA